MHCKFVVCPKMKNIKKKQLVRRLLNFVIEAVIPVWFRSFLIQFFLFVLEAIVVKFLCGFVSFNDNIGQIYFIAQLHCNSTEEKLNSIGGGTTRPLPRDEGAE